MLARHPELKSLVVEGQPPEQVALAASKLAWQTTNSSLSHELCGACSSEDAAALMRILRDPSTAPPTRVDVLTVLTRVAEARAHGPQLLGEWGLGPVLVDLLGPPHDPASLTAAAKCATALCSAEETSSALLGAGVLPAAKALCASPVKELRRDGAGLVAALAGPPANRAQVAGEDLVATLLGVVQPARRVGSAGGDSGSGWSPRPTSSKKKSRARPRSAPPEDRGEVSALDAIARLCTQSDFRDALHETPGLFEMLFQLCDHPDMRVVTAAHAIAANWEDERFGACWNICCACKQLAMRLMLPARSGEDERGGSEGAADGDGGGGAAGTDVADYGPELTTLQRRLQESMKDADTELASLISWQSRLSDREAACDAQQTHHLQRSGRPPYRSTKRQNHARLARDLDKTSRSLRCTLEGIQLAASKVLRHGRMLLEAEEQVQVQIVRLKELHAYAARGKTVEVANRWTLHSSRLCREALVALATKLEMSARSSVEERLASARHVSEAERLVEWYAALTAESEAMLAEESAPSAFPAEQQPPEGAPSASTASAPALPTAACERGVAPIQPSATLRASASAPSLGGRRTNLLRGARHGQAAAARARACGALSGARGGGGARPPFNAALPPGGGRSGLNTSASASGLLSAPLALKPGPPAAGGPLSRSTSAAALGAGGGAAQAAVAEGGGSDPVSPDGLGLRRSKSALVKPYLHVLREPAREAGGGGGSAGFSAEELTALASDVRQGKLKLSRLKAVFNAIDADGSGSVDAEEVEALLADAGIDVPPEELHRLVRELDVDGNGTLDFVELLDLFRAVTGRAREAMREQMQVGLGAKMMAGPLLQTLLADSLARPKKPPYCAALQLERRLARERRTDRRNSVRRRSAAPLPREGEGGGEGGQATARRPAGGLRRSPLSEALGVGEAYSIALLLLAFTEPAATLSPEQGGGPAHVCVETLQRVYVWARISSVTETGEIRGLVEQRPHADGRVWLRALEGWIAFMRLPPPAHGAGGKALIRGLRRCHPASRQPALAEYDVVRLLEMFGSPSLHAVPYPDMSLLEQLPLAQMWPSVATLKVSAVERHRSRSRVVVPVA